MTKSRWTVGNKGELPVVICRADGVPVEIPSGAVSKGLELEPDVLEAIRSHPDLDIESEP